MTVRIALLLLAVWALTRLLAPASEWSHLLLLVGLLLLLIGALKARDVAMRVAAPKSNGQEKREERR